MNTLFPKKQIVTMFLQPILDPVSKTYYDVITLSNKPHGPLSLFVRYASFPKLSEFKGNNFCNSCLYVLTKFDSHSNCCKYSESSYSCKYSGMEDISEIFSFLVSNGYVIEEELTRITSQFNDGKRVICVFSYTE